MSRPEYSPQPGPQTDFLMSEANEIMYGGARGGGKSYGALLDFLRHYLSHGAVQGVLFRRTYPELENLMEECRKVFPDFGGRYAVTSKTWAFPGGAQLKLRHLDRDADADRYQGHQYQWMGVDEAGAWPDPAPLWKLKATLRSAAGIPSRLVLTGNPGGVGQTWLRDRYIDHSDPYELVADEDDPHWFRTFIPAKVWDNVALLNNDPGYISRLRQVGNAALVKAWLDGDWHVTPGAYFEGAWDQDRHVVEPFEIPSWWRRWRSLDWGYARPYAVYWWAESPDGQQYVYREMYGYGGKPNTGSREDADTVAKRILLAEEGDRLAGAQFMNNPADPSVWSQDGRHKSVFDLFLEQGIVWSKAPAGAGSRVRGLHMMLNALKNDTMFFFSTCKHLIRTLPAIPHDPMNLEDVDTDAEDHAVDSIRYGLVGRHAAASEPDEKRGPSPNSFDWVASKDTYKPLPTFGKQT